MTDDDKDVNHRITIDDNYDDNDNYYDDDDDDDNGAVNVIPVFIVYIFFSTNMINEITTPINSFMLN